MSFGTSPYDHRPGEFVQLTGTGPIDQEMGVPPSVRKDFIDLTKVGPMGDPYVPPWVRSDFIDLTTVGPRGDLVSLKPATAIPALIGETGAANAAWPGLLGQLFWPDWDALKKPSYAPSGFLRIRDILAQIRDLLQRMLRSLRRFEVRLRERRAWVIARINQLLIESTADGLAEAETLVAELAILGELLEMVGRFALLVMRLEILVKKGPQQSRLKILECWNELQALFAQMQPLGDSIGIGLPLGVATPR